MGSLEDIFWFLVWRRRLARRLAISAKLVSLSPRARARASWGQERRKAGETYHDGQTSSADAGDGERFAGVERLRELASVVGIVVEKRGRGVRIFRISCVDETRAKEGLQRSVCGSSHVLGHACPTLWLFFQTTPPFPMAGSKKVLQEKSFDKSHGGPSSLTD